MKLSETDLVWFGIRPVDPEIERKVRESIKEELYDLGNPWDLIFHTVFLTDDMDGPTVCVSGKKDSEAFFCEYAPKTTWISVDDLDLEGASDDR